MVKEKKLIQNRNLLLKEGDKSENCEEHTGSFRIPIEAKLGTKIPGAIEDFVTKIQANPNQASRVSHLQSGGPSTEVGSRNQATFSPHISSFPSHNGFKLREQEKDYRRNDLMLDPYDNSYNQKEEESIIARDDREDDSKLLRAMYAKLQSMERPQIKVQSMKQPITVYTTQEWEDLVRWLDYFEENPEEQDLQELEDEEEPIEEQEQSIPVRSEEILENPRPKETFESKESVCPYELEIMPNFKQLIEPPTLEDEGKPIKEIVAEVEEIFIPLLIFQLIERELKALVAEEESMSEVDEFKEEKPMAEITVNVEEVQEKIQQGEKSLEAEKEIIAEELDEGEEEETIGGVKLLVWLRTINLALHGRQPMADIRRRKFGLSFLTIHNSFFQKKSHKNTQVNSVQRSSAAATLFEQPILEPNSEKSGSGTHQGKESNAKRIIKIGVKMKKI
ncbi:hypothetical protein H6P81_007082 [Aristolochia fimbriata]|uniref:Uncharacterized protein n=1 Tax=Aristolochia fimbriata TaxID=158543 RepID=A0AAV7EZE1_ARIFI|nr:hypothetical protein H6P81_007082 [Aristolochia fimbriata]